MKHRKNRRIERAGVNAAQTLFEANDWLFQPVSLDNDYGKDAYVDAPDGENVTGICAAVQIKSGVSFRRANGDYAIPIDSHEEIWRASTVPMMGIVHDPDTNHLYWCNISDFLQGCVYGTPPTVAVSARNVLTVDTLSTAFLESIRMVGAKPASTSVLDLCSASEDRQIVAMFNQFSLASSDERGMVLLRRLITTFEGDALFTAVRLLCQIGRYPATEAEILRTYRWTTLEILHLFTRFTWDHWGRGDPGEDVYWLLVKDPAYEAKVKLALDAAVKENLADAMWTALYLSCYWEGDNALKFYRKAMRKYPTLAYLDLIGDLQANLYSSGSTGLF